MPGKINKRSITGLKSKKRGSLYERIFKSQVEQLGGHALRIEDGARVIRIPLPSHMVASYKGRLIGQVVRKKQPFDFIVNLKGNILFTDIKTTDKTRLSYSYLNNMVKSHQMESLLKLRSGSMSGIVFFFMESRSCVFYDVNTIYNLKPRKSLTETDGIKLGTDTEFDLNLIFKSTDDN